MLSQAYLKSRLSYDSKSGLFTWKQANTNKHKDGSIAGTIDGNYIRIGIDSKKYKAHRLAWLYTYGEFPNNEIDHKDRNGFNNAITNLRDVTTIVNHKNKGKFKNNNSGVTGVCFDELNKRWKSRISVDGKRVNLGSFISFSDAVNARKNAEVLYGYKGDI